MTEKGTGNPYGGRNDSDPWTGLATAMVLQAARDVREGDELMTIDAAIWLLQDGLAVLQAMGLDIDRRAWRTWVLSGCPDQRKVQPCRSAARPKLKQAAQFPGKSAGESIVDGPDAKRVQLLAPCAS